MGKLYSFISTLLLTVSAAFADGPINYEYWYDHEYSSKTSGQLAEGSSDFSLEIPSPPQGSHFFNLRLSNGDGSWGSVYRKMVLTLAGDINATAYEYWLDSDYSAKTAGALSTGTNSYDIDLSGVRKGLHRFCYRMKTTEGVWGTTFTKYFFCASNDARVSEYEYWLDNDFADRKAGTADAGTVSFDVDLSGFDKSGGAHYFHLRTRDGDGEWNPIYRKRLVFTDGETPATIIGYRHFINGTDLGYVETDRSGGKSFSFEAQLPDPSVIFSDSDSSEDQTVRRDSVNYVVQLRSETGWMSPVKWTLDMTKLSAQSVRISYNGRYLMMETDEESAEIHYALLAGDSSEEGIFAEPVDVGGLATVKAWAVRRGYDDSDVTELQVRRYADEAHAETAEEGLLASAFDWDETGIANNVEEYCIEGRLNEADYAFIRSMGALRHLDLEAVTEARIPDHAFANTWLTSISLPEDLAECGDSILSGTPHLSSVIWNSRTTDIREGLTRSLASNPNMLLYVPDGTGVDNPGLLHVVRDGHIESLTLSYGHPYYAARDLRADRVSLTHEFLQTTEPGVCQGWETIVLPFQPTVISHEVNGPAVPFAAWNEDLAGPKPFWLYRATATGWEEAPEMEAGVPYVISMPNNAEYVKEFNLRGKVTFSATGVDLGPDRNLAGVDSWIDGTRFEGTFMPVENADILSLNVGSSEGGLRPGSTFVPDGTTLPFGAYVSGTGRKAMPLFGGQNGVDLPQVANDGLLIETPRPGTLRIISGRERTVPVTTATGMTIRTLHLNQGEAATLEGLTRDIYIVAGRKVTVR